MKGLLLKDFYMAVKYCRVFIFIILVFSAVSLVEKEAGTFSAFPVLFAGMLPVTLLSYDEKEKWHIYSGTFPYSRAQIVSSKYVFGLIVTLVVSILSSSVLAVHLNLLGSFETAAFLTSAAGLFAAGLAGSALVLPFIFKLGAEKGRIMYFVVIVVVCGLAAAFQSVKAEIGIQLVPAALFAGMTVGTVLLYAGSWLLSIAFYQKRDL